MELLQGVKVGSYTISAVVATGTVDMSVCLYVRLLKVKG